ncbi:hypothetical protein FIBSPDRAFT_895362 [Athelia psychrophila]|uniref:Uncharacterized protein n=1 Tax=Athelia psychrophila TaxID=1759441 RepID=A0A166EQQ2_9AGAM|nr:hypothetical protein FIBSPDRAFT_895362 [Fibularhizoctonia sp. CBS 109695]
MILLLQDRIPIPPSCSHSPLCLSEQRRTWPVLPECTRADALRHKTARQRAPALSSASTLAAASQQPFVETWSRQQAPTALKPGITMEVGGSAMKLRMCSRRRLHGLWRHGTGSRSGRAISLTLHPTHASRPPHFPSSSSTPSAPVFQLSACTNHSYSGPYSSCTWHIEHWCRCRRRGSEEDPGGVAEELENWVHKAGEDIANFG